MSAIPTTKYTLGEYLARERVAAVKSEFYRGEIFAMAGGSPRHNTISCTRQDDGSWNLTISKALENSIRLSSVSCVLSVAGIYEDVSLVPKKKP